MLEFKNITDEAKFRHLRTHPRAPSGGEEEWEGGRDSNSGAKCWWRQQQLEAPPVGHNHSTVGISVAMAVRLVSAPHGTHSH